MSKFTTKDYAEFFLFVIFGVILYVTESFIDVPSDMIGILAILIVSYGLILAIRASERAVEAFDIFGKRAKLTAYQSGVLSSLASNLPELAIGFFAVINNQIEFAISLAVVASGFNVLLLGIVIWMGAHATPENKFKVPKDIIETEIPLLRVGITILGAITFIGIVEFSLEVMAFSQANNQAEKFVPTLPMEAAALMVLVYLIYLYLLLTRHRKKADEEVSTTENRQKNHTSEEHDSHDVSTRHLLILSIFGLLGIILAGEFISGSVETISHEFGVNEFIIAFLVGASAAIPEHAIGIVSARREGGFDLGLGNLMAGVIQNFLFILGSIVLFAAIIGGLPGIPLVQEVTKNGTTEFVPFILLQIGFGALLIFHIKSSITDDNHLDTFEGITITIGQLFVFVLFLKFILLF